MTPPHAELVTRLLEYAEAADGRFNERPLDCNYEALCRDLHKAAALLTRGDETPQSLDPDEPEFRRTLAARALAHRAAPPETPQPAAENGWRDIGTAPKTRERVLLYVPDEIGSYSRQTGQWNDDDDDGYWEIEGSAKPYCLAHKPTHWMPLPLPPVVQTRQEEPTLSNCRHCHEPLRRIDGAWLDAETYSTCEDGRPHDPFEAESEAPPTQSSAHGQDGQ